MSSEQGRDNHPRRRDLDLVDDVDPATPPAWPIRNPTFKLAGTVPVTTWTPFTTAAIVVPIAVTATTFGPVVLHATGADPTDGAFPGVTLLIPNSPVG